MPRLTTLLVPLALNIAAALQPAYANSPDDAKGLWRSADGQGIIEFKACSEAPGALCGTLVWEATADKPDTSCGVRIAMLKRFDGEAWRDGWVFDPRPNKRYRGVVRLNDKGLLIRAYIGTEVLGETEQLTRESTLPTSPVCKK